tara:strand:- start:263 stop:472 length:210 start_codon:yes stop_codon:yes gene_type:complete
MSKSKFRRGTLSLNLVEECRKLKEDIIAKGIIQNERLLTSPKLQDIILEKKNRKTRTLEASEIRRIILS